MAVNISITALASCHKRSNGDEVNGILSDSTTGDGTIYSVNNVQFKMIAIEGGSFQMGSDASDAKSDQKPVHKVTLSDFSIGQTEVTQELWQAVMGDNPSEFSGKNLPVDNVTWEQCQQFVAKLNKLLHDSGKLPADKQFHLPTEAQWEYAARGGNKSKGYKYAGSDNINAVAWTRGNSGAKTYPVGSKAPNELDLFDMSGNVWEWCQDYYDPYKSGEQTNPAGPTSNTGQVIKRGGSWYYAPEHYFRVAFRYGYYTNVTDSSIGMRLCLS
jgi:formylglycine-generating enzyme required for sulfatase activity